MKKPFHFNLLYKLFVDNKGNKTNNWRRLIFGVKSNKWSTLKNYILDSVDSHQYGEFFYLLTHQWKVSTCANCGNELKYNNGYKTYCCRKCARACQHTETQASNTRKQHIKELDDYVTINKDNLSNYDNKYMSKLCVNNKLTKYYISIGSSINKKYANIRYWLNNRIPWANSWSETIYCVLNNIVNIPKCKVCGNNAISLWHTTLSTEQKQNKLEKEYETKHINGTFNTSKMENMIGDYIMSKFPDMKRQYKSAAYPFLCDYYIPSLDIYIEYQGSWTHGGHPFDTQENDNTILKMWQNKHTKYYDNAIHTWTIRDVEKRETAKKNNIKYYELWSDGTNNEFEKHKKFIDSLCCL